MPTKVQKLAEFVEPVKAQWQSEGVRSSLKSYVDFCQFLGLDKAQRYLASIRAHEISDWGTRELDAEGLALQRELEERVKVCFLLTMRRCAGQADFVSSEDSAPTIDQDVLGLLRGAG